MDFGLTGKIAMIAGASRGLGYAVARGLAAEGVSVSISSRQAPAVEDLRAASRRRAAGPCYDRGHAEGSLTCRHGNRPWRRSVAWICCS
jgi:3-oxoacyl-[acyl-carrier protein] reductase